MSILAADKQNTDINQAPLAGMTDIYKIGIGPSSSHTIGPMRAAFLFLQQNTANFDKIKRLKATAYGSLAWTGAGHATDKAMVLGLAGNSPDKIDPDLADGLFQKILTNKQLVLPNGKSIVFEQETDVIFNKTESYERHTNAMRFEAIDANGHPLANELWFSIGGGFVVRDGHEIGATESIALPYPFTTAAELIAHAKHNNLRLTDIVLANETARSSEEETYKAIDLYTDTMLACIDRGLKAEGHLAGNINIRRRAKELYIKVTADMTAIDPNRLMNYVSTYAIAVGEENAANGRIVTAPTNGAAGVIPAVLRYYLDFFPNANKEGIRRFFLASSAIGALIKRNASISGAEVGCQGEIGSASSMAAGGLAAALGASDEQIENAAEIALEHHLGMTCDPVDGLVQVPCIERNAFGAVKAINATSLAMMGDGTHFVSLDQVIQTMHQTGLDMHAKYKETSLGGLAITACGFRLRPLSAPLFTA